MCKKQRYLFAQAYEVKEYKFCNRYTKECTMGVKDLEVDTTESQWFTKMEGCENVHSHHEITKPLCF